MPFISDVDHVTLRDGVYNNVQGNLVYNYHNHFYQRKRHWEEMDGKSFEFDIPSLKTAPTDQERWHKGPHGPPSLEKRRLKSYQTIRYKYLTVTKVIGSRPGYCISEGEYKGHAIIVKVFKQGTREQMESIAALSRQLLHPHVLRVVGISSPESSPHFIAYESVKNAEVELAVALKDDLTRS
ncbi:hypothetical protein C8R44DRAFT_991871 [Mycena epipterygia]|nr:hypothetical protein C8R44DRAFT_991871 [Mycena epipterygia]